MSHEAATSHAGADAHGENQLRAGTVLAAQGATNVVATKVADYHKEAAT
jgi:hypothetical protein